MTPLVRAGWGSVCVLWWGRGRLVSPDGRGLASENSIGSHLTLFRQSQDNVLMENVISDLLEAVLFIKA